MDTRWWDKFHASEDCDKIKHAHAHFPIGTEGARIGSGLGTAKGDTPVASKRKGRKSWHFSWQITHRVRTYGWYMVFADCSGKTNEKMEKKKKKNRYHHKLNYEIEFLNKGNDHLSADERWIAEMYLLTTLALIVWLLFPPSYHCSMILCAIGRILLLLSHFAKDVWKCKALLYCSTFRLLT